MLHDYYMILGVEEKADIKTIKDSYRKLVQGHHPDRGGNNENMILLNEAYFVLTDPSTRANYDSCRKNESHKTVQDGIGDSTIIRPEPHRESVGRNLKPVDQAVVEKAKLVKYGWHIKFKLFGANDIVIENKSPFALTNVKAVLRLYDPHDYPYPQFAVYSRCINPQKSYIVKNSISVINGTSGNLYLACDENILLYKCPICNGELKNENMKCYHCLVTWRETISEANNPKAPDFLSSFIENFKRGFKGGWNG